MKHSLFLSIAAGLILAACSRPTPPDQSSTLEFSSLSLTRTYRFIDSAAEFNSDADITFRDSLSAVFPKTIYGRDFSPLRDTILSVAFDTVTPDPLDAAKAFFSKMVADFGYDTELIPDSLASSDYEGFCNIHIDIQSLSPARLTFEVTRETYLPRAAHGISTSTYINFDLISSRLITLRTIFTPEGLEELPSLIARQADRMVAQIGKTAIDDLPSDDNFFISTDDRIVFVYQPYEVASYAQGLICIPFHPYQLSHFLTPEGLEIFGLK